jgi:hypothetical protein
MKWLEWKNSSINKNYIYFRNENSIQKKEGELNFEGIHYKTNNIDKLQHYRLQKKTDKCCYLQFNYEIINNDLEKLKYNPDFKENENSVLDEPQQPSFIDNNKREKLQFIDENINEILYKKELYKQNILINKSINNNKNKNKNIKPKKINFSDFLSSCYEFEYICLDIINTPKIILSKIDILDFIYKCYLINSIPIFISNINIQNRISNSLGFKLDLPFISINSFDKLILGFKITGTTNKDIINNIPFKYINEISKKDYDLDKLIKKDIFSREKLKEEYTIQQQQKNKVNNSIIEEISFKQYFKTQHFTNLKYDDIILNINQSNITNTYIQIIFYILKFKQNKLKPRLFAYINKITNEFLSILEFTFQDYNIKIPIFKMKEEYLQDNNFNFIKFENHHLITMIQYILQSKNTEIINLLFPPTLNEYSSSYLDIIKNNTSSNTIVGINLYHYNRININKLQKYVFLNEIYYILSINHIINNISNNNINNKNIHFIIFSNKNDIPATKHIFEKIKLGFKNKFNFNYTHISEYNELFKIDNQNELFMKELYLLRNCDFIINSNNLFSILSMVNNNNKIYYPKKWLKDNIQNDILINYFDKEWIPI